jgi:hypothetical protein
MPRASITVSASAASTRPMAAMRPPLIATSARTRGAPVPSNTRPSLITTS